MATQGLRDIWGLEQLDRWFPGNLRFISIVVGGTALLGVIIASLQLEFSDAFMAYYAQVPVDDALREDFNKLSVFAAFGLVLIFSTALTMSVLMVRLGEADSSLLLALDQRLCPENYRSAISSVRLFFCILFFALMHQLSGLSGMINLVSEKEIGVPEHVANASTVAEYLWARITLPVWSGPAFVFLSYLASPLAFIISGMFLELVVARSEVSCKLAREISIDLILLDRYTVVSNEFVRVFSVVSVLVTLMTIAVSTLLPTSLAALIVLAMLGIAMPFFYWLGKPVLIFRQRVKQKKAGEIEAIQARVLALSSEGSSLHTRADLLALQMFVESRWEWPIATNLQKILLFGLLPPLTWMMAATIENLMYAQ